MLFAMLWATAKVRCCHLQYSISEIADVLLVSANTLRHWEKALETWIQPKRDPFGQRLYDESHFLRLKQVAALRDAGFTLEQIQHIFVVFYQVAPWEETPAEALPLRQAVDEIKDFLHQELQQLDWRTFWKSNRAAD